MTITDYHAHYAAVRARLRGTAATPIRPIVRVKIPSPPPPPLPSGAVPPKPSEPVLSLEDQMRLAKERVKGMLGLSNRRRLLLLTILEEHGVYWNEIIGQSRRWALVSIRHEIYVALFNDGMSLSAIGRVTNRDHTTILHSLRKDPKISRLFKVKPRGVKHD